MPVSHSNSVKRGSHDCSIMVFVSRIAESIVALTNKRKQLRQVVVFFCISGLKLIMALIFTDVLYLMRNSLTDC